MEGKICIITGATSGIGKVTALELAHKGATLILACRNMDKAQTVSEEIISQSPYAQVDLMHCDLSSLQSVRSFAQEFQSKYQQLHVLINNGGLFSADREETIDGFEMTFGTNHLGPFLLTNLLLDTLKQSPPARIINVASKAHYRGNINWEDVQYTRDYNGLQAYSNSKLANVLFTYELARRLQEDGITVNCLHPGVIATGIWPTNRWYYALIIPICKLFMRSPEEGARATIYLASSPEVDNVTGKYFDEDTSEKRSSSLSQSTELQKKLWDLSVEMCQL